MFVVFIIAFIVYFLKIYIYFLYNLKFHKIQKDYEIDKLNLKKLNLKVLLS